MSIKSLEALQAIGLLDSKDKPSLDASITPHHLQEQLFYYRDKRLQFAEIEAGTTIPLTRDLAALLSSQSYRNTVSAILPTCFIHSRVYADDPLFRLAYEPSQTADALNQYLKMDRSAVTHRQVAEALQFFSDLSPLIRCGVLNILPISQVHCPPEDPPIYYSEDRFRSEVPKQIYDFAHTSAKVSRLEPLAKGGGYAIVSEEAGRPSRGIRIGFQDDAHGNSGSCYLYMDVEVLNVDRDAGIISTKQTLNWESPPNQSTYDAWVEQSINRTIINRLNDVSVEMGMAAQLCASYHTESSFESALVGMPSEESPLADQSARSAVRFLDASAPYLTLLSPEQLSRLITDSPALFDRWRNSLLYSVDRFGECGSDFELRAQQLLATEIIPQVQELQHALQRAKASIAGAAAVTVGSVGMAMLDPSAALPLGHVLALAALATYGQALPAAVEYIQSRNTPAYVWNKLSRLID